MDPVVFNEFIAHLIELIITLKLVDIITRNVLKCWKNKKLLYIIYNKLKREKEKRKHSVKYQKGTEISKLNKSSNKHVKF